MPLVTVACITYNHAPFIKQCLDGFLMQKVNFDYEIVVNDDASTDNTQEVLKEYHNKYPDKIKLILRTENLYSIGVTKIFYHTIIKHSKAKYIATCEGDDYWTDEYKLQKQIDFLEANPEYNFSMGRVMHLNQADGALTDRPEFSELFRKPYLTIRDYLKSFFSQTSTYVFKREGFDFPSFCNHFHGEDILIVAVATKHGKIKFHDEVFSVYRIHPGGVTQKAQEWKMHFLDINNYTEAIHILLDKKYKLLIQSIKFRLWLDYKVQTSSNRLFKYSYIIIGRINFLVKRHLL
jgi:glycosyltransferase involved in cell wall biosynthesis